MTWNPSIILAHKQYAGPDPQETMRTLSGLALHGLQRQQVEATLADLAFKRDRQNMADALVRQYAGAPPAELVKAFRQAGLASEAREAETHAVDVARGKAQYEAALATLDEATRKKEREQDTKLVTIMYGAKTPEDWEQRKAFAAKQGIPQEKLDGLGVFAPGRDEQFRNLVISPEEQVKLAETERHHRKMEARPTAAGLPPIILGEGGAQYFAPTRVGGTATPIPDPTGKQVVKPTAASTPKPLPKAEADALSELAEAARVARGLADRFKDEYAGKGFTGGAKQAYGQTFGSFADKGTQEFTEFWADYAKEVDLPQRNKTFGASLSAGEKSSWEGAKNIKSANEPEMVRAHLEKMAAIAEEKLAKRGRAAAKSGYAPDAVEQYAGPLGLESRAANTEAVTVRRKSDGLTKTLTPEAAQKYLRDPGFERVE